jgi:hypothetical protein
MTRDTDRANQAADEEQAQAKMLAELKTKEGKTLTPEEQSKAASRGNPGKAAEPATGGKKVKLTIHSGEGPGDKGEVFMQHNYRTLQVKRDVQVEVDAFWVDVLKETMIDTVSGDGNARQQVRIPRYSFDVES